MRSSLWKAVTAGLGLSLFCEGCAFGSYCSRSSECPIDKDLEIVVGGNELVREVIAFSEKDGQRMRRWREYDHLFNPCFNGVAGDFRALGYVGQGGPFAVALWLPLLIPDMALSSVADVLTLPWQLRRYYQLPENVRGKL